jgi:hypothetical protein
MEDVKQKLQHFLGMLLDGFDLLLMVYRQNSVLIIRFAMIHEGTSGSWKRITNQILLGPVSRLLRPAFSDPPRPGFRSASVLAVHSKRVLRNEQNVLGLARPTLIDASSNFLQST